MIDMLLYQLLQLNYIKSIYNIISNFKIQQKNTDNKDKLKVRRRGSTDEDITDINDAR